LALPVCRYWLIERGAGCVVMVILSRGHRVSEVFKCSRCHVVVLHSLKSLLIQDVLWFNFLEVWNKQIVIRKLIVKRSLNKIIKYWHSFASCIFKYGRWHASRHTHCWRRLPLIPRVPHYRDDLLHRHIKLPLLIYIESLRYQHGLLGFVLKIRRFHEIVKVVEA
jgi:hypothetical protein